MSFERLTTVLKQISSANTYASVRVLLEERVSTNEQEKIVRLCLRRLPHWFSQTPGEIKDIKLHFHQYILQLSSQVQQHQLIDLLLNELKTTFNDYLLFLLVDVYEKNYSKLLNELEVESNVTFLLHLPDRISNVCMTNIPGCFQMKTYFNRLSVYIEEQLITYHYPNMLAQIDTNVSFLNQIVHRAAKLGYTEYIWRPLYKNLFRKKSLDDPLWLRLVQYFLLETIDTILLYTIEHGNGKLLDVFLSDRILHLPALETYLIETLLFRKQLAIESVRTILIYLTMSPKRLERCFERVFSRFLQLWSQETFIRFSSNAQHLHICQCICICLALNHPIESSEEKEKVLLSVLNGIRVHLESTFDYIRRRGQLIGEFLVERLHFFSQSNSLQFNTYDKTHPEVQILTELVNSNDDRELSDDELPDSSIKKDLTVPIATKPSLSTKTVVLREASIDDDDDEFQSYDYSHDTTKSDVQKPSYIRTCLADLIATDKVPSLEAALQILPSLVEMYPIECEEVALELVRILLNYNSSFGIEKFDEFQLNGLISLCSRYPILVSDYLCRQFYERNYTLIQRSLILKTIQESGKKLSQIEQIREKIEEEFSPSDDEDDDQPWHSIINQRLKLKSKYKRTIPRERKRLVKENHFAKIVGHFFYPLIAFIDQSTAHLTLIDGDNESILLCELLACLGRLCIHAQNTLPLRSMLKQFLQVLHTLQRHDDAGVRHAVVYAYACALVSINETCHDEDLQSNFIDVKQWLDQLIVKDTNTEVQKLARSVRQILLKTLQEMTSES